MEQDETGVRARAGGVYEGCVVTMESYTRDGAVRCTIVRRDATHLVMKRNGLQTGYVEMPSWTGAGTLSHTVKGKQGDVGSVIRVPLTGWIGWTGRMYSQGRWGGTTTADRSGES